MSVAMLWGSWMKLPPYLAVCSVGRTAETSKSQLLSSCNSQVGSPGWCLCTAHAIISMVYVLSPARAGGWENHGRSSGSVSVNSTWERSTGKMLITNLSTLWSSSVWFEQFFLETMCTCSHIRRNNSCLGRQQKWKLHGSENNNGQGLL